MAITIVGSPTTASAANGGDVTLSMPVGLAENDVVYALWASPRGATAAATSSAGWTELIDQSFDGGGGGTLRLGLYRKVIGASPDANIVLTGTANASDAQCACAIALRGVDTTTPEDAVITTATADSTNPDPASITTVTAGAWVLAFAGSRTQDPAVTAPSGYSNSAQVDRAETSSMTAALATIEKASAGAEDPPSWTDWNTAPWAALTVAVRPAAVAAAVVGRGLTNSILLAPRSLVA
jgi:hypothetical protein